MRRSGKEPSRVDLASYFASALQADTEVGVPEVAPQVCFAPASHHCSAPETLSRLWCASASTCIMQDPMTQSRLRSGPKIS